MSDSITVDAARLPLLLGDLRLPTVAKLWQTFTERADREGWPSARLLATLAEFELAERAQRRVQRHLLEARLPSGKTLDSFDFATVPMVSHAHVTALASGDAWLKKGANILLFGPSGSGKSHLGAALGHALVENGYRVLFTRTTDLVQRLQTARLALSLESAIDKLDKYHLIILDDLCYVNRDQAETSALFKSIAARYERRSLLVTANRPFGEWTTVFPDAAMTLAAVDRLVHHAVILEMNVESYRQRSAAARQNRRATSDSKRDIKHKEATGHPNCRAIREQAAIALAVVSTKDPAHFRTTPGGYFHGMVAKAKAGALNLDRTLWAMRRTAEPKPPPKTPREGGLRRPTAQPPD